MWSAWSSPDYRAKAPGCGRLGKTVVLCIARRAVRARRWLPAAWIGGRRCGAVDVTLAAEVPPVFPGRVSYDVRCPWGGRRHPVVPAAEARGLVAWASGRGLRPGGRDHEGRKMGAQDAGRAWPGCGSEPGRDGGCRWEHARARSIRDRGRSHGKGWTALAPAGRKSGPLADWRR